MVVNPKRCVDLGYVYNIEDEAKQITINGIDLRLKEVRTLSSEGIITTQKTVPSLTKILTPLENYYEFKKGNIYDILFYEGINVPNNMVAKIQQRSSLARIGGFIVSGLYDSGYQCENVGVFLVAQNNFKIQTGARVGQIIFQKSDSYGSYNGQWQNGKGWIK